MRVCGNHTLDVVITSLMRGRRRYVADMLRVLPGATVHKAIDGRDRQGVANTLWHEQIPFHHVCPTQGGWGMLALLLTRHRAFARQTSDFQLLLEDDLHLLPNFAHEVRELVAAHYCHSGSASGQPLPARQICTRNGRPSECFRIDPDVVQLGGYGEAYLTSRAGAERLVQKVRRIGIVGCADQQYNVGGLMNLTHAWSRLPLSWQLLVATNAGPRANTATITQAEAQRLRECSASQTGGGGERSGSESSSSGDTTGGKRRHRGRAPTVLIRGELCSLQSPRTAPPERPLHRIFRASRTAITGVALALAITPCLFCVADAVTRRLRELASHTFSDEEM